MAKETKAAKTTIRRRKFQKVSIPLIKSEIEILGNSVEELKDKTINLDLTRQLKGKSVEATVKISINDNKAEASPVSVKLLPYFIRRVIRKRISYVEDSFDVPSQESLLKIKPFVITRKKVSRAIRKALRNRAKNWITDYVAERKDSEIFQEIFANKLQRSLSLYLKKTYPLSLCEIRILGIIRTLRPEEIPKIEKKKAVKEEPTDQLAEIEQERVKQAEEEIKKAQKKASKKEDNQEESEPEKTEEKEEIKPEKKKRVSKKKEEKSEEKKGKEDD